MEKANNKEVMAAAIAALVAQEIDAYLIITSEGSDRVTSFLPGVGTVGSGAFLLTAKGEKIAVCSKIDAQDIEESGLFDQVRKYENYDQTLGDLVKEIAPKRLALNFSKTEALCDGLTVGRYRRFLGMIKGLAIEEVSADLFLPKIAATLRK